MAYQIDFLPVGNGNKSGDRICFRFKDPSSAEQKVCILDGGFKDTANELIEHIDNFYKTNTIDYVISSHPDSDHSAGLQVILEKMDVKNLVMHLPWNHAEDINSKIKNKVSNINLENRFEKNLKLISDIEDLAKEKDIPIIEPFSGLELLEGKIKILGPSQEYYKELLPHFDEELDQKKDLTFLGMTKGVVSSIIKWVKDSPLLNLLDDGDTTSIKNNSSTIILIEENGRKALFTADIGKRGLEKAIEFAKVKNIDLSNLFFFDVPHHGSKRNLGKTAMGHINAELACISASKEDEKHPAKKVTNHLNKLGIKWSTTEDGAKSFPSQDGIFEHRDGWVPITYSDIFHENVED